MILGASDIHNHILPGVDDGFQDEQQSLEAIQIMASAGCKNIVFTPHINPDVFPDINEEKLRDVYDRFIQLIPEEWEVTTHLAAEYMLVNNFEERLSNPEKLLKQPDGSLLIEMSYFYPSRNLKDVVFNLVLQGITPVLAHPERYLYNAGKLSTYDTLREMGCKFQMNRRALDGCYGPESMKILRYLNDNGWYDYMATDLHTIEQLEIILQMKEPQQYLKKRFWDIFKR